MAAFRLLGDRAWRVETPLAPALQRALQARPPGWLRDSALALGVLVLYFDGDPDKVQAELRALLAQLDSAPPPPGRELVIPVRYGGPDLAWVAQQSGLGEAGVIARHAQARYQVAFVGFTPGFAFLTGTPQELQMPRLDRPRERVPAGSVGLGGPWSGVYPLESPGGWRLIGHTDLLLFHPRREPASLLAPGDRVRFEPV